MNDFVLHVIEWIAGIIASLIVVFLTQLVNSYFFTPRKELSDIIKRLIGKLKFYSNIITNPGRETATKEAQKELRDIAMELKAHISLYPKCRYRKINAEKLEFVSTSIVFLSNSIFLEKAKEYNSELLDTLLEMLKAK